MLTGLISPQLPLNNYANLGMGDTGIDIVGIVSIEEQDSIGNQLGFLPLQYLILTLNRR